MKNHEKENHHCKTLNKDYHVNVCSFQKEKLKKLVEIYKINDNASVEDSNFNLEEVKGEPKLREVEEPSGILNPELDWDKLLPPDEYVDPYYDEYAGDAQGSKDSRDAENAEDAEEPEKSTQALADFKVMFPDMDAKVIEARANNDAMNTTTDHLFIMSADNEAEKHPEKYIGEIYI